MATTSVAAALFYFSSLALLPGLGHADETVTHTPPAVTASEGPIVASYNHAAATTTLSGLGNATATSSSIYPSATATSAANGTLPACQSIQYAFPAGTGGNATRAAAVREAYQYAWDAYAEYAFGHDDLAPLSKSYTDDWCECSSLTSCFENKCPKIQR